MRSKKGLRGMKKTRGHLKKKGRLRKIFTRRNTSEDCEKTSHDEVGMEEMEERDDSGRILERSNTGPTNGDKQQTRHTEQKTSHSIKAN